MVDFRKSIPVAAVIAMLIGAAPKANAVMSCNAGGAVTPELRSEGITELAGDLVFNCFGGESTLQNATVPKVTIQVFMNTPLAITSRLIGAGPYAGLALPGTDTIENSQCAISGIGSSVAANGTTLTLTLAIAFKPGFTGNKVFYLAARNDTQNSGWQAVATVGVP